MTRRLAGSLFTGTGALDMAAVALFDAEVAWVADLDKGSSALLAHHFPGIPNLGDITKVDWHQLARTAWVYVLSLGWPCQPFSLAGKRKGAQDERALWPECERAIRALRPRYLLLENVPAVVGIGELERVATSLATLGYRFAWTCLSAASVGAPHIRERFFLVAVAEDADGPVGDQWGSTAPDEAQAGWPWPDAGGRGAAPVADASGEHERCISAGDRAGQPEEPAGDRGAALADPNRGLVRVQPEPVAGRRGATVPEFPGFRAAAHADRDEREREPVQRPGEEAAAGSGSRLDWAGYAPAIRRWERVTGQAAPAPTVLSPQYKRRLTAHRRDLKARRAGKSALPVGMRGSVAPPPLQWVLNPAFTEWMMGLPAGWITDVPGLTRPQQLKLAGNGVVPQQAYAAAAQLLAALHAKQPAIACAGG